MFPPRGAAELLSAFARHRIPVEGADTAAARRMLHETRGDSQGE
jgi:hypothetical protein